jgi:hypothetical protein
MKRGEPRIERRQVGELQQSAHQDKTDPGHNKHSRSRQQDGGQNDGHQVKGEIVALQISGDVDDARDDEDVGKQLQISLQEVIQADLVIDQEKQVQDIPEDGKAAQILNRMGAAGTGRNLLNGVIDGKNKSDDDKTDLNDPGKPAL